MISLLAIVTDQAEPGPEMVAKPFDSDHNLEDCSWNGVPKRSIKVIIREEANITRDALVGSVSMSHGERARNPLTDWLGQFDIMPLVREPGGWQLDT